MKPAALSRAVRLAARASVSPRTLTKTRTLRRSGLTDAPVRVTKPMRGSWSSRSSRREISSRMRSDMRSVRVLNPGLRWALSGEELDVASQELPGGAALDLLLDGGEGLLERAAGRC